jgi:uncharacterized repeat protein (TIGR03806 family)
MKRLATLGAIVLALLLPCLAIGGEFPAILAESPPKRLSEFGFFPNGPLGTPAPGIVAYDLATPLFSDRALKFRFVYIPSGQSAAFSNHEAFDFPVGSALIKTFAYPADFRDFRRDVRPIETRLLLRGTNGWQALAYVWNDDGSEAELKIAGKRVAVSFLDSDGMSVEFDYAVPNRNQCKGCHSLNGELVPLGPKARNLNRASPVAGRAANQLVDWRERGILSGLPDLSTVERAAVWADPGDIDGRARAWLDVNCAHCHRDGGPASNSGLALDAGETEPVRLGIGKRPAAAGRGAGDRSFDIVAGKPDRSILLYRIESVEPGVMMPELGRHLADPDGAKLIREWIASLR